MPGPRIPSLASLNPASLRPMASHAQSSGPVEITARDPQTGAEVTFRWSGAQPPTQADLAEVFTAADQGPQGPQAEAANTDSEESAFAQTSEGMRSLPATTVVVAAPGVLGGINAAARAGVGPAAKLTRGLPKLGYGAALYDATINGNPTRAAKTVATTAGVQALPKALTMIARQTGLLSRLGKFAKVLEGPAGMAAGLALDVAMDPEGALENIRAGQEAQRQMIERLRQQHYAKQQQGSSLVDRISAILGK